MRPWHKCLYSHSVKRPQSLAIWQLLLSLNYISKIINTYGTDKYRSSSTESPQKNLSITFQQPFRASNFPFNLSSTSCNWRVFSLAAFLRALDLVTKVSCPVASALKLSFFCPFGSVDASHISVVMKLLPQVVSL